jgi:hypothetical protein
VADEVEELLADLRFVGVGVGGDQDPLILNLQRLLDQVGGLAGAGRRNDVSNSVE